MRDSIVIEFDLAQRAIQSFELSKFTLDSSREDLIYWIHCDLSQPDDLTALTKKLALPDYFLELCHENDPIPKLFDNSDMLTMQVQSLVDAKPNIEDLECSNLIIHLTERYCLTASYLPLPSTKHFLETHPRAIKYAKTPCFILFLFLDHVINAYSEALLEFDLMAEQMDIRIREMHEESYSEIVAKEKQVMKVKRYTAAIQDMLMRISGRNIAVISEPCRISLSNLFNHSQMIVREADAVKDILKGALAQIDNALMHKMNDTMRVLTAFASIFLPLSLIAGIYGMNFDFMPELHWKYGYFFALGLMVGCAFGLLVIFKKNKWF